MSTTTESLADLEAVIATLTTGKPVDPEVSRRIDERADRAREELRRVGVVDAAVDLIRSAREE